MGTSGNEKRTRAVVECRSNGVCEICGMRRATNMHHRKRAGRVWLPSNVLHVCGSGTTDCHGRVTNTNGHRGEFEAKGWIMSSWRDPAATAVRLARRGWCYLHDDGSVSAADASEQDGVDGDADGAGW